jgi:hypothetical protein
MEQINLNKKVYSKNQYERVINTKFSQLATTIPSSTATPPSPTSTNYTADIDKFFQDYTNLFLQIPKTGAINSHEYLIKRSIEYTNFTPVNNDLIALIDEINQLQVQNLELNQQIINLTISGSQI